MAKKSQKRSKQSKAKKMADLPARREADGMKGGSGFGNKPRFITFFDQ